MSSDDEDMSWDVDALKAVRVFFDPIKKKPILKYLTSWLGFEDYWDEWTAGRDFADPEQVTTFNKIIPAGFDRTKVGAMWEAPKDWVDKAREMYYRENPHANGKARSPKFLAEKFRLEQKEIQDAKFEGRAPNTLPQHMRQIRENEAIYKDYFRQPWSQQKKKPKRPPTEGQRSLSNLANLPKGPVNASTLTRPLSVPTKRKKHETIVLGLRYKTRPITYVTGLHSNATSDRFRGRYHAGKSTPMSGSTTSRQPRPKHRNDIVIYPPVDAESDPASPETSATNSLFDNSSSEETAESSDSTPLARQVSARNSKGRTQSNRRAVRSTSSSDSDVPLSKLAFTPRTRGGPSIGRLSNGKATNVPENLAPISISHGLVKNAFQPDAPRNSAPIVPSSLLPKVIPKSETRTSPLTPITAKANAWKDVGTLIPLGRPHKPKIAQASILIGPPESNPRAKPPLIPAEEQPQESPSPPLFFRDDDISTETHMDVDAMDSMPDPVDFLQSVVEEIPVPVESDTKVNWTPVDLILQSTNGDAPLCKVVLQKVTAADPPNLKWIHKNGFKIRDFRSQSHLSILLLAYEPRQHARLAAHEEADTNIINAFTSYMFENNMFALADTEFDGTKLCFYPSQSSAFAESLDIQARSELRQGPLRLLVTLIKPTRPQPPQAPLIADTLNEHRQVYKFSASLNSATERGLRLLRLPAEIKKALQHRYPNEPVKRTYVISSVENFGFRHPSAATIESQFVSKHAASGVIHQEETLALIHVMNELGYEGNRNTDSAAVVFIHNAAFDMQKHLLGLHARKLKPKVWFFAYGPFHALESRLWGVREIFKRGGIVTFTASSIMENVAQIPKLLQCIDASTVWIAFISPLVIGMLQAAAINDPDNQSAMEGLLNVLDAVKAGKLSITKAPPHPWKVEDWPKWLEANSDFFILENFGANSESVQDTILDAAEKVLDEFANPPPLAQWKPIVGRDSAWEPTTQVKSMPHLEGRGLEDAVDGQVFEDLRQMLFMPVLHTEYRRFVVLRATRAEVPSKDSIEHLTFQGLIDSDTATFGKSGVTKAVSKPPPTPSSATAMQGTYKSPIFVS